MKKLNNRNHSTRFGAMLLTMGLLISVSQFAEARKHRVNFLSDYNVTTAPFKYGENYGGNSSNPVFNTPQNVLTSPFWTNGDTIYLEPTPVGQSYAGLTITKPAVIIGTGYFLNQNTNVSNDFLSSNLEYVVFNSTSGSSSSGSQILGVNITSQFGIDVNVSNIIIKRCYFNAVAEVNLTYNISNVDILQNFFDNAATPNTATAITSSQFGGVTDLRINYNIFKRCLYLASNNSTTGGLVYSAQECKNNTFDVPTAASAPSIRMDCNSFHNNIIKNPSATLSINSGISSSSITNNTGAAAGQFDYATTAYDNKLVTNMGTLFITPGSSTDGNYQLQSGVASNYPGLGGGDRGAFGGSIPANRYTLSGLANIPVIYDVYTTGTVVSGTLPIVIKARTIK